MRASTILSIFYSSTFGGPIQLISFWQETDFFALQIQNAFRTAEAARQFSFAYDRVREVMEFYQDTGDCDYSFSNPTFELVEAFAFDRDLPLPENIDNLVWNVDEWIDSYSCVGLFGDYENRARMVFNALKKLREISEDASLQTPEQSSKSIHFNFKLKILSINHFNHISK